MQSILLHNLEEQARPLHTTSIELTEYSGNSTLGYIEAEGIALPAIKGPIAFNHQSKDDSFLSTQRYAMDNELIDKSALG